MKINEFKPQEPKSYINQQDHPDFSSWLDKPKETNQVIDWETAGSPTKQNSGDEYYWQHQNQLQQSELHFNAKPVTEQQQKHVLEQDNAEIFNVINPQQETTKFSFLNMKKEQNNLPAANNKSNNPKFMFILNELEQALEQSPLNITANNKLTKELPTQNKIINRSTAALNTCVHFKNSHLFISGEQAELTLNLQHSSEQEQKELMQLIQDHLKKKGLVLSRLIINGVNK